ncbi:OPT4 Oligopeptide transporter 4 [Candida maltosa Xu316]|uniref:Oligopeptide transporter, putative n=1 Tax=Candida maltosa (strain Xu316) TaxID=1245528 RepID=M3J629_CANMX|nr:Oligopeptide transporter, putative [Candida maltosa Xu316]
MSEEVQKTSIKDQVDSVEVISSDSESTTEQEVLEPDVAELPKVVREIVPLEDDPTIQVVTIRYFILSVIFIIPGAFIDTMNSFRTTSAAYSIFFVQIASHWCGKWLARVLPNKQIKFGRFINFNLNPCPWSIKETILVTITASSGATGNLGTNAIALADLFYGEVVSAPKAIFFMWSIVFLGYSVTGFVRNFVMYEPKFTWPQALMQTTLFQTQRKSDEDGKQGSKQMKVFFIALLGLCAWQFFPEFIFPMTSSLAFLCWVAPENYVANFIGSGLGGMGFLNLTLDWSNITSNILLYPYWVQVIQFVAFVLGAWVLIPAVKWGNLSDFKYGLMSNSLFMSNGTKYPTAQLLNSDLSLNETRYAELGPVHLGAQRAYNIFFDYAAYVSGFCFVTLFGYKGIIEAGKKIIESRRKSHSINLQYTDRLNKLQSAYADVPSYYYLILFLCSFITILVILIKGFFAPWWTLFVATAFGVFVCILPLLILYATSGFQLPIGTFNEVIYAYIIQNQKSRHPAGALVYSSIAGDVFYRCQYQMLSLKIGFYNHLPPQTVFWAQIFGELLGVPTNYGALRWVLNTKRDLLTGEKTDPLHQWTAQSLVSYQSNAIQYVVLGPKKLFHHYPMLPYGFLIGVVAPVIVFALHKLFPKSKLKFHLWNTTIFFSTMSNFYGNVSTGYFSQFIGGTITMFWAYRYKHALWKKYNYLLAAALDTGLNLSILLIFLFFSAGKTVTFPEWWGNNGKSIERCFAMG